MTKKKLTKESFQLKWELSSVKYQEITHTKKTKSTSSIWEKEITNNKSNNNDTNNINLGLKENSVENRYKKIIHIN